MPGVKVNGRRGWFLVEFGAIWAAYGVSVVQAPRDAVVRHAMAWLPDALPLWVLGAAWIIAALSAVACGVLDPPRDRFGFMCLAGMTSAWAVAWAVAWATGHEHAGYLGVLVFAAAAAATVNVAGMQNPALAGRRL